jgi:hypothetical protein
LGVFQRGGALTRPGNALRAPPNLRNFGPRRWRVQISKAATPIHAAWANKRAGPVKRRRTRVIGTVSYPPSVVGVLHCERLPTRSTNSSGHAILLCCQNPAASSGRDQRRCMAVEAMAFCKLSRGSTFSPHGGERRGLEICCREGAVPGPPLNRLFNPSSTTPTTRRTTGPSSWRLLSGELPDTSCEDTRVRNRPPVLSAPGMQAQATFKHQYELTAIGGLL